MNFLFRPMRESRVSWSWFGDASGRKKNTRSSPPYAFFMVSDLLSYDYFLPKKKGLKNILLPFMWVWEHLQHKKAKRSLVELYNIVIKNNFRFYSFGDAMVIL